MSRINRPPLGLQGLLDSQNFGENPSELGAIVRPTIDLFPFYGTQLLRSSNIVGSKTGAGLIEQLTVGQSAPGQESIWLLHGVSMYVANPPAGPSTNRAYVTLESLVTNVQRRHIIARSDLVTITNAEEFAWGFMLPQPLALESNITINFYWSENSALTTENVQCSALYYAIPD